MKYRDKDVKLYIVSMNKRLRITAIFDNDDEANQHMAKPTNDDGVICCYGGLVFLANVYDRGI